MSKIYFDKKAQLVKFTNQKKNLKNDWELKFIFLNMPLLKPSNINTAQKFKMARMEMYNFQTRLGQFKEQKKS